MKKILGILFILAPFIYAFWFFYNNENDFQNLVDNVKPRKYAELDYQAYTKEIKEIKE